MPKEPWQMTKEEYTEGVMERAQSLRQGYWKGNKLSLHGMSKAELEHTRTKGAAEAHHYFVELALKQGKPVPAEVLQDYPDLARKPVDNDWDGLHIQSREQLAEWAGFQKKVATQKWDDIDPWMRDQLSQTMKAKSKGKATLNQAISKEDWAKGIMAIHELGKDSKAVTTPVVPKASLREAERILRQKQEPKAEEPKPVSSYEHKMQVFRMKPREIAQHLKEAHGIEPKPARKGYEREVWASQHDVAEREAEEKKPQVVVVTKYKGDQLKAIHAYYDDMEDGHLDYKRPVSNRKPRITPRMPKLR